MGAEEKLARISLWDRMNATTLGLVTSEMSHLNAVRKKNGYSRSPTFPHPTAMPFEYATVAGTKIRIARSQAAGKPTLVMLCPFPQSIMGFAPIWDGLAAEFNILAYDLPGFGRSEGGVEFMTFEAQGRFLRQVLNAYELEHAHILGPDVGMPAALYEAAQSDTTVKSIIVGDGPGVSPSSNASVIRKMVDSAFWRFVFRVAGAGALVEAGVRVCNVRYSPNEAELSDYKKSYAGRIPAVLEWFKGYPDSLAVVDPMIDHVKVPTLIFWGAEDAILYPDNGERLHARMPGSELRIFEGCGHFIYQDCRDEFLPMLIEWVKRHDQAA